MKCGRAALVLLGWLIFSAVGPSDVHAAGGIEVSPTTLTLKPGAPSTMLSITNRSETPLRLNVKVMKWKDDAKGETTFEATKDIVFFPSMITLNPGEARNLRVGTMLKDLPAEQSYRVFIQELPRLVNADEKMSARVSLLSQILLPLFIEPATPKGLPEISGLTTKDGKLLFKLKNRGNAHYIPTKLILRATQGAKVVHEEELHPWYVLPGAGRDYDVKLSAELCAKTGSNLEVFLESRYGPARAALAQLACNAPAATP